MDLLGPFELESAGGAGGIGGARTGEAQAVLTFYPAPGTAPTLDELLAALPPELSAPGLVQLETRDVARDWVEGWRDHFRPIVIGEVRIRPPWEPALAPGAAADGGATHGASDSGDSNGAPDHGAPDGPPLAEVVINPGLGFGTGLHPTTRGTLRLLQVSESRREYPGLSRGPLVDAGTGSGILAIAAAKLGWGPIFAFDNDPVALTSARENIAANGVERIVEVSQVDVARASAYWFEGATVLANMTLEPVLALLRKIAVDRASWSGAGPATRGPRRIVVSGILAGDQERELIAVAGLCGLAGGERIYEAEWMSLELYPVSAGEMPCTSPGGW